MRNYSKTGGKEGKPAYRIPSGFIFSKIKSVLKLKALKDRIHFSKKEKPFGGKDRIDK